MSKSLKQSYATAEFRRSGGFTKGGIKVLIGDDMSIRESKRRFESDKETNFSNKVNGTVTSESGKFLTHRADMAKKVRMPKNRQGDKMRKKDASESRNHSDAILAGRTMLNDQWEKWCEKHGFVSFLKFQNEILTRRVYKSKLAAL